MTFYCCVLSLLPIYYCYSLHISHIVIHLSIHFSTLTRSRPPHDPQLLPSLDGEVEAIENDRCVLAVPHLVVLEGDGSAPRPAWGDLSILNMQRSLRLTVLHSTKRNLNQSLISALDNNKWIKVTVVIDTVEGWLMDKFMDRQTNRKMIDQ